MKKIKDFVIYRDDNYFCAFPSLVMKKDGEILCAFRRAPNRVLLQGAPGHLHVDANSYLVMVRSKDGGAAWTKNPELIFAHPQGGSQDPCMTLLKDGSIICSSYGWAPVPENAVKKIDGNTIISNYAFMGGYILRSEDGGKSWLGPTLPMHIPGDSAMDAFGNPCPSFNRGEIIQGKNGKLYWAVAVSPKEKSYAPSVHLIISSDRGDTWSYACPIAEDNKVTFNETSLVETAKGDLVAFMRTEDFDGKLAYARSIDGGKNFGPWQDGGFFGHPFQATKLKDGRIFLVYGYRRAPFGIRARLLNPECTDISTAPELVIREDGGSGDLGYPWSVQLPNGNILAAYYFNIGGGPRFIGGSLIKIQ